MRKNRLWFAVSMLSFVFGCGSNAQHGEQESSGQTPKASIRSLSQGSADGGVAATTAAVSAAAATQSDPSPTVSYTVTTTVTGTGTGTITSTGTKVVTVTNTGTGTKTTTGTATKTNTQTSTGTKTYSAVTTLTATFTGTSSATQNASNSATGTASWVGTYLGTGTATGTKSFTATLTGTTTLSGTLSITATGTQSKTATKTVTGTAIGSGSKTTTQTYTAAPTATTTTSSTGTGTTTTTQTKTGTVVTTGTGTTTATATNACYGTWAFCDNFESGNASKWSVQQGNQSDFTVASDPSRVYLEGSLAASTWHTAQAGAMWMDQTIEAKMKAVVFSSSTASMALFGRYEKNWLGDCAYYVSLRGDGKVALGKRLNGVDSVLGSAVSSGIVAGTWYALKLNIQGSTINAYLNGTQILSQTDSTCGVGSVGVASFGASFEADDVRVTAPTTNTCVQNWRDSPCADYCKGQTQSDRVGCKDVLDCYASNGCGPASCGGQDDVCGVNYPRLNTWGTASKIVADQVYQCMGCAGSVKCDAAKKADWTLCSDGSACSWDDTCQNGVCKPGAPTVCGPLDQCHIAGTCDLMTGACSNPTKDDNTTCDDGRACTVADTCHGGVCISGEPKSCPVSDKCHVAGSCDTGSGDCLPETPLSCDDGDLCTVDSCDPEEGCRHQPVTCAPEGECHEAGTCDSTTGACTSPPAPDGTLCDTSDSCTHGGLCASSQCICSNPNQAPDPTAGFSSFPGMLSGDLTVTPTGAATYKVPIAFPPGIAGMAPNLALVYSSQGGNGIAGQGWDLTGLSMIHRCPKTRPEDGYARPLTLTDDLFGDDADGICLDGKRLFDRGAKSDGTGRRYEPEITDFSDITLSTDKSMFIVVTKAGETRYYGMTDKARVRPAGFGETTAIWLLEKVVDVWGNYYDIRYNYGNQDFESIGIIVSAIEYTGRLAGSSQDDDAADVPTFEIIKFVYQTRPDVRRSRLFSATLPRSLRLNKIITSIGTYTLNYDRPPGMTAIDDKMLPSLLQKISYCPATGDCAEPLVFDWDGGGYNWELKEAFKLPDTLSPGTWFMDLDGDGRQDMVSSQPSSHSTAWRNTGTTFQEKPKPWSMPSGVWSAGDGDNPGNTAFADLDGDGLVDAMHITNGPWVPQGPSIWLNRILHDGQWTSFSWWNTTAWAYSVNLIDRGALVDMDGDGRADLVSMASGANEPMKVLINTGFDFKTMSANVWRDDSAIYGGVTPISEYELRDVNRDGLPDLVGRDRTSSEGKTFLNTGKHSANQPTVWIRFDMSERPGRIPANMQGIADFDGDGLHDTIQYGCGSNEPGCDHNPSYPYPFIERIILSTGAGYDLLGATDPRMTFLKGFTPPTLNLAIRVEDWAFIPVDINADGLADLVQRVMGPYDNPENASGRLLFNTGTTFVDLDGKTSWKDPLGSTPPVPRVPLQNRLVDSGDANATFIDLDGDGVPDLASTRDASRNTYRPPMITHFPNGLAKKTVPTYKVITTADAQGYPTCSGHPVYCDSTWNKTALASGTSFMITPMRVVASLAVDDGIGGTATTDYEYRDLRVSPSGRGPQGFGSVITTGPEDRSQPTGHRTRIETKTEYLQPFPYTGLPGKVKRYLVDSSSRSELRLMSVTVTDYCDAIPATEETCTEYTGDSSSAPTGRTRFVRPTTVLDTSFLVSSDSLATNSGGEGTDPPFGVSTKFEHDKRGNPLTTTVSTQQGDETYEKKIENVYGASDSPEERLGKVTLSTVTTRRVYPQDCLATPITHTTKFEYGEVNRYASPVSDGTMVGTLGLLRTIVEPGSGAPIELHTAYQYDRFGNVTKTTSCANEFASCGKSGATGSTDLPYRTTSVSYDPAEFTAPADSGRITTLPYGAGQFPVKTTNAAGHAEMTAYDPRFGTLMQQTGPNGISTCREYDGLGRQTSETTRCTATGGLTTTIKRLRNGLGPVVTVSSPPTGSPTWAYADTLGRTTMTLARAFDSSYVKTLTVYDNFGRVATTTAPYLSKSAISLPEVSTRTTSTSYDPIGRVTLNQQDLGVLDGISGGQTRSTAVATTYDGPTVTTIRTVNGETRTRSQTKNALGKIASVTDAKGVAISYSYDADGNLAYTAAPSEVCESTSGVSDKVLHITYDARGRKQSSHDPDLGDWGYQYNSFGDLVLQTDGKGRPANMKYDTLGRMRQRDDDSGTGRWIYDAAPHGIGKLAAMVSPSDNNRLDGACQVEFAPKPADGEKQTGRSYHYTAFGDVEQVTDCTDGSNFLTTYAYDQFGRSNRMQYPDVKGKRLAVKYVYTDAGYLHHVADEATGAVMWAATAMNAAGQVTDELLGNGVQTQSLRNDATGWLLNRTSTAHADGDTLIQGLGYAFDEAGNLRARQRKDGADSLAASETFGYDPIDRLLAANVQTPSQGYPAESYSYDDSGNLLTKTGKSYKYGTGCLAGTRTAGPHAVCQVDEGATYSYDGNGNLVSAGDHKAEWNAANKATRLTDGTGSTMKTADFIYGADGARVVQVVGVGDGPLGSSSNNTLSRTVYVGLGATGKSVYERTKHGNIIEHSSFIYAGSAHGGSAFAVRVVKEDTSSSSSTSSTEYHHFDHIGSVVATSDERGHVTTSVWSGSGGSAVGYDPWGAIRKPSGQSADPVTFAAPAGNRGYTDHEAIPSLGLVNMNGRIYDPVVGRFLSPDPNVQFASDLQSYNRYSYVLNNPLRYTDPTGYYQRQETFLQKYGFELQVVEMVGSMVLCSYGGAAGCYAATLINTAINTTAAIESGTPWDRALMYGTINLAIGFAAGAVGGAVGNAAGGGVGGAILGGAISGGIMGAVSTVESGGSLGENMLEGSARGAFFAAVSVAFSGTNPVSQESAAPQGGGDQANLDGSRPSEELKNLRRAHLLELIDKGGITEGKIGDLPVAVWGGSDEARDQTLDALRTDLSTERGQQMLGKLTARLDPVTGQTQTLDVFLDYHVGGSYAQMGGNTIVIDTAQVNGTYFGSQGAGTYDYERILAHELGHAVYARTDYFNLNTIENENKIMGQLGYTNDRYSRNW